MMFGSFGCIFGGGFMLLDPFKTAGSVAGYLYEVTYMWMCVFFTVAVIIVIPPFLFIFIPTLLFTERVGLSPELNVSSSVHPAGSDEERAVWFVEYRDGLVGVADRLNEPENKNSVFHKAWRENAKLKDVMTIWSYYKLMYEQKHGKVWDLRYHGGSLESQAEWEIQTAGKIHPETLERLEWKKHNGTEEPGLWDNVQRVTEIFVKNHDPKY